MSIITRHLISNNFSLIKLEDNSVYNKSDLESKIDLWKYILKYKCHAKEQESILVGITTLGIDYFAICFAALELSLKIVIIDYNRQDEFSELEYTDPKTKVLAPIDIFLHDIDSNIFETQAIPLKKFKFFAHCSLRTYNINAIDSIVDDLQNFALAKDILPKITDVAIRCTSSGTTGTPKIVEHTHEFLYKVSNRNSTKFSGDCLHIRNLNHGSSIAVFLLPSMMSDSVSNHLVFNLDEYQSFDIFVDAISPFKETLEFINFPYPFMIDEFINSSIQKSVIWKNLKVQTLSYIQDKPKKAIKDNIFASITSIFGSNETSGPIFECTITKENPDQESCYFTKVDDFYKISLDTDGLIDVMLPVYNTSIITNDIFKIVDGVYVHCGRKDMVKINGEIIDYEIINGFNTQYEDLYVVVDSLHNSLYVAFWNSVDIDALENLKVFFKNHYEKIRVNKIAVLDKQRFTSGIKIDNELIREYFRNHV